MGPPRSNWLLLLVLLGLPALLTASGPWDMLRGSQEQQQQGNVVTPWGEVNSTELQELGRVTKAEVVVPALAARRRGRPGSDSGNAASNAEGEIVGQLHEIMEGQSLHLLSNRMWRGWDVLQRHKPSQDAFRLTKQEAEVVQLLKDGQT